MSGAPSSGTPRESLSNQSRDRVEIVEGFCGNRARGFSFRGKFVFSRNIGYRSRGVAILLIIVLTPGKPTPKSNFKDGSKC